MIKRKYIRRAYIEIPYCDKCGSRLEPTGIALMSNPPQYPYKCSNKDCDHVETFYGSYPENIKYEFEEAECDV